MSPSLSNSPKRSTLLIERGKYQISSSKDQKNIFQLKNVQQLNKTMQCFTRIQNQVILQSYKICGDNDFKNKFIQQHHRNISENSKVQSNIGKSIISTDYELSTKIKQYHTNQNPQNNSIKQNCLNKTKYRTFLNKFSKDQLNKLSCEQRIFENFREKQKEWEIQEQNLKKKMNRSQTVTFNSVHKLYVHENPQKISIINDMIPQYWRNSLRNNDKRLKSHVKGHRFKEQIADEMFQTMKGTKKLEDSIPSLSLIKTQRELNDNNFIKLKGRKLQKLQGYKTVRQFHQSPYQSFKNDMDRVSNLQNNHQFKRCSNNQTTFQATRNLTNYQTSQQIQSFYGNLLASQRKINKDIEFYKRNYERKNKWLKQPLE